MSSETKQRLLLNLGDVKMAAVEKLPTIARGEVEHSQAGFYFS